MTQADAYPINHFIGTCLTDDWVHDMERKLDINASERDETGRSKYPFLRKALPNSQLHPRFRIDDPRTATPFVYDATCIEPNSIAVGATGKAFANNTVIDKGQFNGSLVVQLDGWMSQGLTSAVLYILAGEVLGYAISEHWPTNYALMTERMSSVGRGICNPVHVDMEVTTTGLEKALAAYSNESYRVGTVGYIGGAGVYTNADLVRDGQNASKFTNLFSADFWKDYKYSEELISMFPTSTLWNNPKFWPPADKTACPDGDMGCKDFCSKSYACTLREQAGKQCMVVVMGWSTQQSGYIQAMFANNGIPAYFCFVGKNQDTYYAAGLVLSHVPVLYLGFKLSGTMNRYRTLFTKVFFPYPTPEQIAMNTGTFGEKGYGNPTTNPVSVDLPDEYLSKYASSVLLNYPPISSLVSRLNLDQSDIYELENNYEAFASSDAREKVWVGACNWVKKHYNKWNQWLSPFPLCTTEDLQVSCKQLTLPDVSTHPVSQIAFSWRNPNPEDATAPFACDGGIVSLPDPVVFHFSCDQLANQSTLWFLSRPKCDAHFFDGRVSECDTHGRRTIHYEWSLPQANNSLLSLECDGELPLDDQIDCDYLPFNSTIYIVQVIVVSLVVCIYLVLAAIVHRFRNSSIIRNAQYTVLQLILVGGLLMVLLVVVQGGKPSNAMCGLRTSLTVLGITFLIGPLLVKSYMTYNLSLLKRDQRVNTFPYVRRQAHQWFGKMLFIDLMLLVCWYAVAFPKPSLENNVQYSQMAIQTTIQDLKCDFGGSVFIMLVLMWKAVSLAFTLLFSILALNSGLEDDGESFWLVGASASIVGIGFLFVMLELGISLSRNMLYVFENSLALICSVSVVCFVFIPKMLHLNASKVADMFAVGIESKRSIVVGSSFMSLRSSKSAAQKAAVDPDKSWVSQKAKPRRSKVDESLVMK